MPLLTDGQVIVSFSASSSLLLLLNIMLLEVEVWFFPARNDILQKTLSVKRIVSACQIEADQLMVASIDSCLHA